MVPVINAEEVAQNTIGVFVAITAAVGRFGNATVAFFLDLVPERGGELWLRFTQFRDQETGRGFGDFIKSVITANSVRLFYPKGCTLDPTTQEMLVSEVKKAISGCVSTNDDVFKIYFEEGRPYQMARGVSCRGCPIRTCRHLIGGRAARF